MLYILFIITSLFIITLGKIRTGYIFNPLTYYIVFWGFWSVVSLTNPFTLFDVSRNTYLIVWMNITCFSVGFLFVSRKSKSQESSVEKELRGISFINTKKFLFLQVVMTVILIYYFQKYNSIYSSMTSVDSRRIVYELGLLFGSVYEYLFFTWIIKTIVWVSIILLISSLVLNGNRNLTLFLALFNCYLFGQIGFGRFIFFQIIIYVLIALGFKYDIHKKAILNLKRIHIRTKFIFVTCLILAVYFMNLLTVRRMTGIINPTISDHWNVFKYESLYQFVLYFTGSFRTLDYFIVSDKVDYTGYMMGRSTFGGMEEVIHSFITFLLGKSMWTTANSVTSTFTVDSILIGTNITFNAFYTSIMNFYMDGGILFVGIIAILFGAISGVIYNRFNRNRNLFNFSLLVFITYQMIESEFRWEFSSPTTWFVIFILIYINHRYNILEKKKLHGEFI